jgi:predicted PurR-regulated permease PerM
MSDRARTAGDGDGDRDDEEIGASPEPAVARFSTRRTTNVLLALVVVMLGAEFLRTTSSVTLPLAFALFLVAVHWPIVRLSSRFAPRWVGVGLALLVFGLVVGGFAWMIAETVDEVYEHGSRYAARLSRMVDEARALLASVGIEVGRIGSGEALQRALERYGESVSRGTASAAGAFVLLLGFFGLGLAEVRQFKEKLARGGTGVRRRDHWIGVARRIGTQFQRYVVVRTFIGLITGVLSALGALIIGLDFWYLWGLLSFLLNYIPTIGSVVAVIPPTLFALVQFESWGMALLSLGIQGGMQIVMGTWIDPLLQGKYLSLSPLIVLVALTFWGWVWGIGGALIAVPLTIFVALVAREFESTRWIATLLHELSERE